MDLASLPLSKNKVALVTGGSRRIGACICKLLHQANYKLLIHYRDSRTEAEALAAKFNAIRAQSAYALAMDLTHHEQIEGFIDRAINIWGRIDALINNASEFIASELPDVGYAQWQQLFDCNAKAPFFLSQALFPELKKQHGHIINILDIHALKPLKNYSVYCASKAALLSLTKSLALEFAPNVKVNAIAPGNIMWPEGENSLTEAVKEEIIQKIPLKQIGKPDDIAKSVLFMLQHDFITGQIIAIDGGRSIAY